MNLKRAIIQGIKEGLSFPKLSLILVFSILIFTSFVGLSIWSWFDYPIGHTSYISKLLQGYDHDLFQDLINNQGAGYHIVSKLVFWSIILYWIFTPFLNGGLVGNLLDEKDNFTNFLKNGSHHYFPFLRISILFILLHIFILLILSAIAFFAINWSLTYFISELPALYIIALAVFIYTIFCMWLIAAAILSKFIYSNDVGKVGPSVKSAFCMVFSQKTKFFIVGTIFLLIGLGFGIGLNLLVNLIIEKNLAFVILAILCQFFILYFRSTIRIIFYSTYKYLFLQQEI